MYDTHKDIINVSDFPDDTYKWKLTPTTYEYHTASMTHPRSDTLYGHNYAYDTLAASMKSNPPSEKATTLST